MSGPRVRIVAGIVALLAGCGAEDLRPAALDTRHDVCTSCRMSVSSMSTAAQIVAPGEEPRFFDDLGCLPAWLRSGHPVPADARVFVVDHRTSAWIPAATAVFTRVPGLETPMGSGIVAHGSVASRDQDPVARNGSAVPASDVLTGSTGGVQ